MLISHFIEGVRSDLEGLGRLGGDEMAALASRLADVAGPALRARLLEALDLVVAEANAEGDRRFLSLALAGDEVSLVRSVAADETDARGEFSARFALRMPEDLKALIEQQAQRAGASTNSWIVRALAQEAKESAVRGTRMAGRQLRGSGRS